MGTPPVSTLPRAVTMAAGVIPAARARWEASWITGPSMTGSENGIPTSMASAPAEATASTTAVQSAPSPPVT